MKHFQYRLLVNTIIVFVMAITTAGCPTQKKLVPVPNLIGMTLEAAQVAIEDAELVIGTILELHHDTIPAGQVISQVPAGGVEVVLHSAVNLEISRCARRESVYVIVYMSVVAG